MTTSFASFGVCRVWVSDQGTHFKNKAIEALQHALGAHHRSLPLDKRNGGGGQPGGSPLPRSVIRVEDATS
ncbi:Gag-pol Polyprotein [Phytophthora megakarya]|uniref:Gag-pol Polyprotein n=1 Tax=Phytophthora megakarya TaxID=4795 RepID=A0A225VXH0_9STRA|nr:Gag-pol Polyprotein [Phytophthora megakarya]